MVILSGLGVLLDFVASDVTLDVVGESLVLPPGTFVADPVVEG